MTGTDHTSGIGGDPPAPPYSSWGDEEWSRWFAEEVRSTERWKKASTNNDLFGGGVMRALQPEGGKDQEFADAMMALESMRRGTPVVDMGSPTLGEAFLRLSDEYKAMFYQGWYRTGGAGTPDAESGEVESIIPELAPITIGVPGDEGRPTDATEDEEPAEDLRPPGEPPEGIDYGTWKSLQSSQSKPHMMSIFSVKWGRLALPIVLAGAVVAWIAFGGQGGEQPVETGTTQGGAIAAGATDSTSASGVGEEATPTTLGSCATAAAQPNSMTFASTEFGDGRMAESWAAYYSEENDFPTPSFEIGGVPEGTTELAIVIINVPEGAREEVANATELWTTSVPAGNVHWILTGISPDTTHIAAAVGGVGLPEGAIEQDHNSYGAGDPGDVHYNRFLGPHSGEMFLFTLFAMCEPEGDWYSTGNPAWMRGWAIANTWFVAEADF